MQTRTLWCWICDPQACIWGLTFLAPCPPIQPPLTTGWTTRTPGGAAGALPPVDQMAATIGALGVGDTDQVVIVGDDFAGAARVYWTFKVLGHNEVSIQDGGIRSWTGPLETGAVARKPGSFTVHYDGAFRAELPDLASALSTGEATLVDARPMSQWVGPARSPVVRAGGQLPGAVSIDQAKALTPDGRLRPHAELAALFAFTGSKPSIVYCNAGHLSATDWSCCRRCCTNTVSVSTTGPCQNGRLIRRVR